MVGDTGVAGAQRTPESVSGRLPRPGASRPRETRPPRASGLVGLAGFGRVPLEQERL